MSHISDEELFNWNRRGLIPGPRESEEEFIKRGHYCLSLKESLTHEMQEALPFFKEEPVSDHVMTGAMNTTLELYDIQPLWIPLFFSDYKLLPWHGGCAWIFQHKEDSPTAAFFQLRQAFRNSKTYFGIYSRDELIAHEFSHVGRMLFQEPKFEEILAYRSSHSPFRRRWGALVEAPWESMLFVLVLLIIVCLDVFVLMTGYTQYYSTMMWMKLIPLGMLLYAVARLSRRQNRLAKCLSKLTRWLGNEHKANAVLYRLQDEEIQLFSKMKREEMLHYIEENKTKSLRWRLLALAYFV